MKLDSKYFDGIRVKTGRQRKKAAEPEKTGARCQWKGCDQPGPHRAPMGRGRDGQYFQFCIEHVRQYNASYNYFDGMSDKAVEAFQKEAIIGHRPTWKVGSGSFEGGAGRYDQDAEKLKNRGRTADPHGLFGDDGDGEPKPKKSTRPVRRLERKALRALDLDDHADKDAIKARFKLLVKRHHPDGNGGDRGSEEKLREIIQAYNYLKQAGLV